MNDRCTPEPMQKDGSGAEPEPVPEKAERASIRHPLGANDGKNEEFEKGGNARAEEESKRKSRNERRA